MSVKGIIRLIAVLAAAVLLSTAALAVNDASAEEVEVGADAPVLRLTDTSEHIRFISGYDDGSFKPDKGITRAEAAQMLYNLLAERPDDRAELSDAQPGQWYYDAVSLLAYCGVLDTQYGAARPTERITRGELVAMVVRLTPDAEASACTFPDVTEAHPYYSLLGAAQGLGFINGYQDGTFRPDNGISRSEAAAIICRALGRTPDYEALAAIVAPIFSDVGKTHWAYEIITEASIPHTGVRNADGGETWEGFDPDSIIRPAGFLSVGGELYYIDDSGKPVTDTTIGTLRFGSDGRYTSGNTELDGLVTAALRSVTRDDMTRDEKLRAAFEYSRDSFTYLRRASYPYGYTGWEIENATLMLETKHGNCYSYAAVFWAMARQLGYDAYCVSGLVGSNRSPHGWVIIEKDGVKYITDPELEMVDRRKGIYIRNFFMMPPEGLPWQYIYG